MLITICQVCAGSLLRVIILRLFLLLSYSMTICRSGALLPRNLKKLMRDSIKNKGLESRTRAQGLNDVPSTGGFCKKWNGWNSFTVKASVIFRDKVLVLFVVSCARWTDPQLSLAYFLKRSNLILWFSTLGGTSRFLNTRGSVQKGSCQ